jgi:hypothetical protein
MATRTSRAAGSKDRRLLGEEQREDTETFGERHTDDGLDEDLAGSGWIATDGFSSFLADETDANGGAEETECAGDVALDFSDDVDHVVGVFVLLDFRRAHAKHAPDGRVLMMCFGRVAVFIVVGVFVVVIAVIAQKTNVDGRKESEDQGLNQADE